MGKHALDHPLVVARVSLRAGQHVLLHHPRTRAASARPAMRVLLLLLFAVARAQELTKEELLDTLLVGYDKQRSPNGARYDNVAGECASGDGPTCVFTDFHVESFSISELSGTFTIRGWQHIEWVDERLAWDITAHPTIGSVVVKRDPNIRHEDKLWLPAIKLLGAREVEFDEQGASDSLMLYYSGWLFWRRFITLELSCPTMHYGQLPYDTQYCPVRWRSRLRRTTTITCRRHSSSSCLPLPYLAGDGLVADGRLLHNDGQVDAVASRRHRGTDRTARLAGPHLSRLGADLLRAGAHSRDLAHRCCGFDSCAPAVHRT